MLEKNKSSYFKKHWRGELNLVISYWVNTIIFPSIISFLLFRLGSSDASESINLTFMLILFILLTLFTFFIFTPWVYVGLWRSASNHIKKHNVFFWANIVRILIIIGVFKTVIMFTSSAYPQMVGYFKILTGTDETPNYIISLENNNETLNITGGIKLGLSNDVASYIKKYPNIKTIHLESLGGLTSEARDVGKMVQENNLNTYVSGNCMSSCTYIFITGKERILNAHAKLGFHRPAFSGVSDEVMETLIIKDKALFHKRGIDSSFIERIFSTPNSDVLQVSHEELKKVGIVTKFVNNANNFWKRDQKELAILLEYTGIKKTTLEKNINTFMNIAFKDMRASLPTKVDKLTILNSITIKKKSLTYQYTILNNIDDLKQFKKRMRNNGKRKTCNSLFYVYLLKHGVEITHMYRDKTDNSLLASIKIKDCSIGSKENKR